MVDDPYSPDKLITSYPTSNGILEIYQGHLYRHIVTKPPANTLKEAPKTLSLFDETASDSGQEE